MSKTARVHAPTDVIWPNHAVALAEAGHPDRALNLIEPLDLPDDQPCHAARADLLTRTGLLARTGQTAQASAAYDRAIGLAGSEADRAFLLRRQSRLTDMP